MSTKTSLLNGPFDIVSLTCFANIFIFNDLQKLLTFCVLIAMPDPSLHEASSGNSKVLFGNHAK